MRRLALAAAAGGIGGGKMERERREREREIMVGRGQQPCQRGLSFNLADKFCEAASILCVCECVHASYVAEAENSAQLLEEREANESMRA